MVRMDLDKDSVALPISSILLFLGVFDSVFEFQVVRG